MFAKRFSRQTGEAENTCNQLFQLNVKEILALNAKCRTIRVKEGHIWVTHGGVDLFARSGEIIQMAKRGKVVISSANRKPVVFEIAS